MTDQKIRDRLLLTRQALTLAESIEEPTYEDRELIESIVKSNDDLIAELQNQVQISKN